MGIFKLTLLLLTAHVCVTNGLPPLLYSLRDRNGKYFINLDILYVALISALFVQKTKTYLFFSIAENKFQEIILPLGFFKRPLPFSRMTFQPPPSVIPIRTLPSTLESAEDNEFPLEFLRLPGPFSKVHFGIQHNALAIRKSKPILDSAEDGDSHKENIEKISMKEKKMHNLAMIIFRLRLWH